MNVQLEPVEELAAYISYLQNRIHPQDMIAADLHKIKSELEVYVAEKVRAARLDGYKKACSDLNARLLFIITEDFPEVRGVVVRAISSEISRFEKLKVERIASLSAKEQGKT